LRESQKCFVSCNVRRYVYHGYRLKPINPTSTKINLFGKAGEAKLELFKGQPLRADSTGALAFGGFLPTIQIKKFQLLKQNHQTELAWP
jgi:hypothetical protein